MEKQEQILIEKLNKEESLKVNEIVILQQIVDNDTNNIFRNKLFYEYSADDALSGMFFHSKQLTKEGWELRLSWLIETEQYEEASETRDLLATYF